MCNKKVTTKYKKNCQGRNYAYYQSEKGDCEGHAGIKIHVYCSPDNIF